MSEPAPDIFEEDQLLASAAKMDFVAMRHIHNQLIESTDPAVISTLSHAYARHSRCMRQNLACLQRQKANRAKAERDAAQHAAQKDLQRPERDLEELAFEERAEALHDAVGRMASAAAQGDERLHADWVHRFDVEFDDWCEEDDFLDVALDAQVRRAVRVLGLPEDLAERWQDLPPPTYFPDPAPRARPERPPAEPHPDLTDATPDDASTPRPPWRNSG